MNVSAPALANVFTLGVSDLPLLKTFYRDLGWPLAFEADDYAAFQLEGAVLALFPVEKLAADGREDPPSGDRGIGFTIGILVNSPEEVDEFAAKAHRAGGRITKEPTDAEFFVGRSAYFADPEDNYWEIVWAPPDNPVVRAARRAAVLE